MWAPLFISGGGAYCGSNQWLRGPLTVAGRQLLTNGLLPGGGFTALPTVEQGCPSLCPPPGLRARGRKVPEQKAASQKYQPLRQLSSSSQRSKSRRRESDSGRVETVEVTSTGISVGGGGRQGLTPQPACDRQGGRGWAAGAAGLPGGKGSCRRRGAGEWPRPLERSRTVQWRQKPITSQVQNMAATTTLVAFSLRNSSQAWTLYPPQHRSEMCLVA